MKLVIVASGDFFSDYGGGQVYVRNIVDELIHHTDITTCIISFNRNIQPSVKDYQGIPVYQVNNESSMQDALATINPDVVHANGEKLLTARLCNQIGIPCIITAHHGGLVCPAGTLLNMDDEICNIPANYNHCLKCYLRNTKTGLFWYPLLCRFSQKKYITIGKRLKRLPFIPFLSPIGETGLIVSEKLRDWKELAETATHFIAPSNAIADALERNGCPKEKITVIPHGIPTLLHHHSALNAESIYSKPIKFYYVGRINYIKGIHILLKAFSLINNPDIELHLIGGTGNKAEGRYCDKLKKKYKKDTRIVWHGKLSHEQMNNAVKDYHCLIHPAIYLEVFGLNISEALAQQKYVIATRCGGAEMQIHNENEGMLVKPGDISDLQNSIQSFINNPRASKATVETIKQHVQNLIEIYSKQLILK